MSMNLRQRVKRAVYPVGNLVMTQPVKGDIGECWVFRGRTLVPMGIYLAQQNSPKYIFGFDSFEGFDERNQGNIQLSRIPCAG